MKKEVITLWGGFSNDELYSETSREGFVIPATFFTKKEAKLYYEDVRRLDFKITRRKK